jgi:branched-subunit amino acid aminotransferase/4-amino-4-deoxychorismate lyase
MNEPEAYLNGRFVPASQAVVPVTDAGFVQGTTVAEQLRTFGGRLFRLEQHLARLTHSLEIVGVDPGLTMEQLGDIAQELVARNHPRLDTGDDLGLAMFVTPGAYRAMVGGTGHKPTVGIHTFPLAFAAWADKYRSGEVLFTTGVHQTSRHCWPRELKCRSRMHYYLADRQARSRRADARAIMLDDDGSVTETTTSNLVVYVRGEGLVMPPRNVVLPGISLSVLIELARGQGIATVERALRPAEVHRADEVLLTSTSPCLLPVVEFDDHKIGTGVPGDVFHQLLAAWSNEVGVDIATQARNFAARGLV